MTDCPTYPQLPRYATEIPESIHALHRSPKGVARPEDLIKGVDAGKHARQIMKVARKPHYNQSLKRHPKTAKRKKKE
jgi:hypothetical protein